MEDENKKNNFMIGMAGSLGTNYSNITLNNITQLEKKKKFIRVTSLEMIRILKTWWLRKRYDDDSVKKIIKKQDNLKAYLVYTNYNYIYNITKKKIVSFLNNNNDNKLLVIPSLKYHSKESIRTFINILITDCNAACLELCNALKFNTVSPTFKKDIFSFITNNLKSQYNSKIILEKIFNKYKNNRKNDKYLSIDLYMYILKCLKCIILNYYNNVFIEKINNNIIDNNIIDNNNMVLDKNDHDDTKRLVNFIKEYFFNNDTHVLEKKQITMNDVDNIIINLVNKHIQDFKDLINIPLRNGSVKNQIQGRRSHMRRKLISPKIKCHRGQISLRFELDHNQIILPTFFLIHFYKLLGHGNRYGSKNLFNLSNSSNQNECFYKLRNDYGLILKRDPVIDVNSVVFINEVAFAETELIYISPYILIDQNADFDGDAENFCIFSNKLSIIESTLRLSADCQFSLPYQILKSQVTETHIMFMHKKQWFADSSFQFKDIYDKIRLICTLDWFGNSENISSLNTFIEKYPNWKEKILKLIEPTNIILQSFVLYLYINYGSLTASNFLRDLSHKIVEISNGHKNDWFSELPEILVDYDEQFINTCFLKTVLSGAKGSLQHYIDLLGKLHEYDNNKFDNKQILQNYISNDSLDNALTDNLKALANNVLKIPQNGHDSFKSAIEFFGFSLNDNKIYYKKKIAVNSIQQFNNHTHIFPPFALFNKLFNKI
ncbi:MAG: RNA polymerase subunit lef-9 [Cotesia congregata filamentous virus 2]